MNITKKSKILIISPHPDDEALGCGGLIGKCLKEGASLAIVYMCVGSSRQLVTKKTTEKIRLSEINDVKKLTGAEIKIFYHGHFFTRLDIVPQKEIIEKIEDTIEEFKPTIVAVPSSSSYNQDHRVTHEACITALRPTPVEVRHFTPNVLEYFEPYYWSIGKSKQPNLYLDLDQQYKGENLLDFKMRLYKCHKTQVRTGSFPRSIENINHLAHVYGKEIGVSIAEAYHILRCSI